MKQFKDIYNEEKYTKNIIYLFFFNNEFYIFKSNLINNIQMILFF